MAPFRSAFAVVAITFLCWSCSPRQAEVALNTATVSPSTLVDMVEARQRRLTSMVGKGSVTFQSPEVAGSTFFELALKKPDSLLVRFQGPFGMDVGTLFLSREKFVMYNSMENIATTGVPSARAIRSVIPFDLTYEEIVDAFAGNFVIPRQSSPPLLYTIDDYRFLLAYRCGAYECRYWIDPSWLAVTKYQVTDSLGTVVLEAEESSMNEEDGTSAPSQISLSFPGEGRHVSIYYSSQTLNAADPSFAFVIPPNAHMTVR